MLVHAVLNFPRLAREPLRGSVVGVCETVGYGSGVLASHVVGLDAPISVTLDLLMPAAGEREVGLKRIGVRASSCCSGRSGGAEDECRER
jgi:hypothetical protein